MPGDVVRHLICLVAVTLCVGVDNSADLQAQSLSPVAATDAAVQLEPMVITGRADDLLGIVESASAGRVGQEQFTTRPLLRAGEVLEVIPGLAVTQHSGTGKANQYFLRGFNLDHGTDFATFVDGVPVNLPTHAHGQGYMDLNFVIPELVDYVEFRKGPYYADVGDFASTGSAAIRLFRSLPQGLARLSIGQNHYYRLVLADSLRLGEGDLLYAFEGQYYDGPWRSAEELTKFNGFIKYTLGSQSKGLSLTMMGYHADWDSTDQIPQRAVRQGLLSRLGTLDASDGGRSGRFGLAGEGWYESSLGRTEVNAYVFHYRLNLFSNFTFFLDDPVNGDQFEQEDRRYVLGGQVAQTWTTDWWKLPMEHTVGLQVRHDFIPTVGLHRTRERQRRSTTREDRVAETSVSLYYRNRTQWLPKFRTESGLRGDIFVFDVDSDTLAANSGQRHDAIVSPKLSLVFGPWASTEVYLNGGFGLHSNDARGATITIDPQSGERAERVDPLVRSRGAEVGVRSTWIPHLNTTLALWYLELDSELLFVGDAGNTEASRPSRRYGIEWTNFYRPVPRLTLDFDFSHTISEFTDQDPAGDHIPGAFETILAAGASVDLPYGFFSSLRVRYFSPRPLIEDNSERSGDTLLTNLQIGYKYKNFQAQLDVLNLLDSRDHDIDYFYASRLRGEPGEGIADLHLHPVEPRAFRFHLSYRF